MATAISSTVMATRRSLSCAALRCSTSVITTPRAIPTLNRPASTQSQSQPAHTLNRVYTDRKRFLNSQYEDILNSSDLVLVFQPNNLSMSEWNALRRAIAAVPLPNPSKSNSTASSSPATLTSARTGLLASLVRRRSAAQPEADITPLLSGPIALLTCPSLSPTYLKSLLLSINKVFSYRPPAGNPTATSVTPRLMLLGGIMEKTRLVSTPEILEIGKLPELDTLRAQLVGLLEMPSRQTIGVLSQAAGGSLIRTLQGLEGNLKAQEEPKAESS